MFRHLQALAVYHLAMQRLQCFSSPAAVMPGHMLPLLLMQQSSEH
jgi:hypothetical protein